MCASVAKRFPSRNFVFIYLHYSSGYSFILTCNVTSLFSCVICLVCGSLKNWWEGGAKFLYVDKANSNNFLVTYWLSSRRVQAVIIHYCTKNYYRMAPTTSKSVSEITTNLLPPPLSAFKNHDHSATTDGNFVSSYVYIVGRGQANYNDVIVIL